MIRAIVLALTAGLLLVGCGSPRQSERPQSPSASTEPTATLQSLHGDDLMSVVANAIPEMASMKVSLRSGEPTGSAPFVALGLLQSQFPGRESYQVSYAMPAGRPGTLQMPAPFDDAGPYDQVTYQWNPAKRRVEWMVLWASGSLASVAPLGHAGDVSTETVRAVLRDELPPPAFEE